MKKTTLVTIIWSLALIILFFLATSCSGQDNNTMKGNAPKAIASYEVPAEKSRKWESLKNVALKDYDVCQEHCGYELSCLDRCEAVYNNRLEREYKILLDDKVPVSSK